MFVPVDRSNLWQAAGIHSVSWQASHRAFCAPDFIALHTPERQEAYVRRKMSEGSCFYLLVEKKPVGIVSVRGSLIEDLYVLPAEQRKGYGTRLLEFAVGQCSGLPTLWILENNTGAERLYRRLGFQRTGRAQAVTDGLTEIELAYRREDAGMGNCV